MIIVCDYVPIKPYFYETKPFINRKNDFGCWMPKKQSPKL